MLVFTLSFINALLAPVNTVIPNSNNQQIASTQRVSLDSTPVVPKPLKFSEVTNPATDAMKPVEYSRSDVILGGTVLTGAAVGIGFLVKNKFMKNAVKVASKSVRK